MGRLLWEIFENVYMIAHFGRKCKFLGRKGVEGAGGWAQEFVGSERQGVGLAGGVG